MLGSAYTTHDYRMQSFPIWEIFMPDPIIITADLAANVARAVAQASLINSIRDKRLGQEGTG
jgi:hypothetical protein